jgi:RNA polymerase primary sigma factor
LIDFGIQQEEEILSDFASIENKKNVNLYDWQIRAIKYFREHNYVTLFNAATGVGKTKMAIELLKEILILEPEIRILIVVPKNVILETGWYKELYKNGISLTKVGVFYGGIKEYGQITLTNMQCLNKISMELFDCILLDEAHSYGTARVLDILKETNFRYKIGLTATVERLDDMHWKIIEFFNYNIFKYTPEDAMNDDILNKFNFTNIGVELDVETRKKYDEITAQIRFMLKLGGGFKRIMRKNSTLKIKMLAKMNERKQLVYNYPIKFDVVSDVCEKHIKDKIIIFSQYNDQTNKFYWYLLEKNIKARIIHSGVERKKREEVLMDYMNDKFNVLLTTRVMDEGVNIPAIDCGIITANDASSRQMIQRLGRVLRKKEKISSLYQLYARDTMESEQADERCKLFKQLCSNYEERIYNCEGVRVL